MSVFERQKIWFLILILILYFICIPPLVNGKLQTTTNTALYPNPAYELHHHHPRKIMLEENQAYACIANSSIQVPELKQGVIQKGKNEIYLLLKLDTAHIYAFSRSNL